MVIVQFPNGAEWSKANWIFGQLHEDVVRLAPDDAELKAYLNEAEAYGILSLDSHDSDLNHEAIQHVTHLFGMAARRTLAGDIGGWKDTRPDDIDGQKIYLKSMTELLELCSTK